MPNNPNLQPQEKSTALGEFLSSLDKNIHDLLMIALNLEMSNDQSKSDKQNRIKTEILKCLQKGA